MESIITQIVSKFNMHAGVTPGQGPHPSPPPKGEGMVHKYFYFLVFVISILIAFFAGRTFKFMENKTNYSYEVNVGQGNNLANSRGEKMDTGTNVSTVIASKGGKKYYFVWCKAAANIREKNKRYFADEAAAQKAGLTLANSCK